MAQNHMPDDDGVAADPLATFNEYRSLLFSIAYRMVGTVADSEDMLQDAFIRWQQAPRDEIRSPKAFLVTIVSRLCINHLQSARVQREEYVGQWLPEPIVTDAASDGGMAKFAPKTFVTRLVEINGEPGFVSYFNGKPAVALVLHISDDSVQKIFAISNPAKLARLPGAPS